MKPLLIGLTGRAQSGKDSAAAILKERFLLDAQLVSLASLLKQFTALQLGLSVEYLESRKTDPEPLISYRNERGGIVTQTVRELWTRTGTEAGRTLFGDTFWIDALFNNLDLTRSVIVRDVRFDNEAVEIRKRHGLIIETIRPGHDNGIRTQHASEAGVSRGFINYSISATTLRELENALADLPLFKKQW